MTCYSMEQHPSNYSFQALYKSFDSKKDNIRQNKKQPLPSIKSIRYNSILCNTVSTTSHSKLSTRTLDSNYYKISKTLQAIRHKVKSNSQCHNLPETIRSYGGESIRQLTDRKKKKDLLVTSDNPPISEFMSESKEICMKNLLIKIIKTESSRIEEKEVNIGKALDIEKINLENDQYLFHEYSETKKKSFREIEKQLLELEKNNKMLSLKLKDIKIENLGIKDEIRKYINLIEINRQYAFFINRSMKGGKPELFNVEYRNVDDIINHYGSFLHTDPSEDEILQDPNQLIKRSEEFEDIILRFLMKKQDINNLIYKEMTENQKSLDDLTNRENELIEEYVKVSSEYKAITSDYRRLNTTVNPMTSDWEFTLMIQDLHKVSIKLGNDDFSSTYDTFRRTKNENRTVLDFTKECIDKLSKMENKLNASISKLSKCEIDTKPFNFVLSKRKHFLKDQKQLEYKQKLERFIAKKREQAVERTNRLVIKSRKTEGLFFMNKKEKLESVDLNELKEKENNNLIHYY